IVSGLPRSPSPPPSPAARAAPRVQGARRTGARGAAPTRRGAGGAGDGGGDGERGRPLTIARNALGIRPGGRLRGSRGVGRRSRASPALRVSPRIWLSYFVPHQRWDGAPSKRAYPLAGPRL